MEVSANMRISQGTGTCPHCGGSVDESVIGEGAGAWRIPHACSCPAAAEAREREEREETEAREREERAALVRKLERANIPRKFWASPVRDEAAYRTVMKGGGLYIQGSNGAGKTELASAIGREAIKQGRRVCMASTAELKGRLFSTGYRSETEEQMFGRLAGAWLLIVDDIGKESGSKSVASMLYRVFDERDKSQRPVIVTSNFSKQELTAMLAQCGDESLARAIVSRLFGMTRKIELTGRDWRVGG